MSSCMEEYFQLQTSIQTWKSIKNDKSFERGRV